MYIKKQNIISVKLLTIWLVIALIVGCFSVAPLHGFAEDSFSEPDTPDADILFEEGAGEPEKEGFSVLESIRMLPFSDSDAVIDLSEVRTGDVEQTSWAYVHSTTTYEIYEDVSVIGTMTNNGTLKFDIYNAADVTWTANLTGNPSSFTPLMQAANKSAGTGRFLISGGQIVQDGNGRAFEIIAGTGVIDLVINGGTVSSKGTTTVSNAIETVGNIIITDGTLQTTGYSAAAVRAGGNITITGGTIDVTGNSSEAVFASGDISINSCTMSVGADIPFNNTVAISAEGNVTVGSDATVKTLGGGAAISVSGTDSVVNINGGTIETNRNTAISATGKNAKVFVNNGVVKVNTQHYSAAVIQLSEIINAGDNVIISESIIETKGEGNAVFSYGNVVIRDSQVIAVSAPAINTPGKNTKIIIDNSTVENTSGPAVSATGANAAVLIDNSEGTDAAGIELAASGYGVVVERVGDSNSYSWGTNDDLFVKKPASGASVTWITALGQHGVRYANGLSVGFLEVRGVTVSVPSVTTSDTIDLNEYTSVSQIQTAIFDAFAAHDTVTVVNTGSYFDAKGATLEIYIPGGATLDWAAVYTSTAAGTMRVLIDLTGDGAFNVIEGGEILAFNSGYAINTDSINMAIGIKGGFVTAYGDTHTIYAREGSIVMSDGLVQVIGRNASAIVAKNVIVSGGVIQTRNTQNAIYAINNVSMTGGIVWAEGDGNYTVFAQNNVMMDGAAVYSSKNTYPGYSAVGANGNITMIDSAVTTHNRQAVWAGGKVEISGSSMVMARGIDGAGVGAGTRVEISGDSKISTPETKYWAISSADVVINGGTLQSGGVGINARASVTVNGGMVMSSENTIEIYDRNGTVRINGGAVASNKGYAIRATNGPGNSIVITGGLLFCSGVYQADLNGSGVMYYNGTCTVNEGGGDGILAGWMRYSGLDVYTLGSDRDLSIAQEDAVVEWDKKDGVPGVSYAYGENSGFLAVPEVKDVVSVIGVSNKISISPTHAILTDDIGYAVFEAKLSMAVADYSKVKWQTDDDGVEIVTELAENRGKIAHVRATVLTHRTVKITATYEDAFFASTTIKVLPGGLAGDISVSLLEKKATINKAKTEGALIPISIAAKAEAASGMKAAAVNSTAESFSEKTPAIAAVGLYTKDANGDYTRELTLFEANMYNGSERYIEIRTKDETKTGNTKGVMVKLLPAGVISPPDDEDWIEAGTIDLTVVEQYPKITLKAENLNLFFPDKGARITATSTAGECEILGITAPGNTVYFDENGGQLKLATDGIKKAGTVRFTVDLKVEGYKKSYKTAPKMTVKVVKKAPKLKLSQNSVTFADSYYGSAHAEIRLLTGEKKVPFESGYKISSVYAASHDAKDRYNIKNADVDISYDFDKGVIFVRPNYDTVSGTQLVGITFLDSDDVVFLSLKVTMLTGKNISKLNASTSVKNITVNWLHSDTGTNNLIAEIPIKYTAANTEVSWDVFVQRDGYFYRMYEPGSHLYGAIDYYAYDNIVGLVVADSYWLQNLVVDGKSKKYKIYLWSEDLRSINPNVKPIQINLTVERKDVTAKASYKGKIDLANPHSSVNGTVKYTNTMSSIENILLLNEEQDDLHENYEVTATGARTYAIKVKPGRQEQLVPGVAQKVWIYFELKDGTILYLDRAITPTQTVGKALQNKKAVTIYKKTTHAGESIGFGLRTPANVKLGNVKINAASVKNNDHFQVVRNGENSWSVHFKDDFNPDAVDSRGRTIYKSSYTIKLELWAEGTYRMEGGEIKALGYHHPGKGFIAMSKPTVVNVKVAVK